ncbi:MAG: hypothetical protein PGN21_13920 [Sphingomonas paucimobilis]
MIRKLFEVLALGTIVSTSIALPVAAQVRRQDYVIVWYTDESMSTVSGQRIAFCDGGSFRSGTPTLYEETTYYGCD